MSYDIWLKDRATNEPAVVPGHLMIGGTYKADYHPETGTFTPALNTEATLNITYNYSSYYREAYEDGIRAIRGKTGADSIPILNNMINMIKEKYTDENGWINTERIKHVYLDSNGNEINPFDVILNKKEYETEEEIHYIMNEGDMSNYWNQTAANAISALYKLIALAKMRPDCVWVVE